MSIGPMPPPPQGEPTEEQIATYIAALTNELRHIPKGPRFRTVDYLLDMLRIEAEKVKGSPDTETAPPPPTP